MKTSKILAKAKKHLWSGTRHNVPEDKFEYICHCVEWLHDVHVADRVRVRDEIESRLTPWTSAKSWLQDKVGADEVDRAGCVRLQRWRHAWLDQLIAEFKAKGD
jgi:hypothetical protein